MEEQLLECENMLYDMIKPFTHYYEKDDLYQAGALGLKRAYDSYDEKQGTKFSTHAYLWMKGEVLKHVNKDKTIPVSRYVIKENRKIETTRDILRQQLLREPTIMEISLVLEKEENEVLNIMAQANLSTTQSLSEPPRENQDLYNSVGILEQGMNDDILSLRIGIDSLSSNEQQLIYSRYYCDLSQKETSEKLGISQATLSRKEGQILQKLKVKIE